MWKATFLNLESFEFSECVTLSSIVDSKILNENELALL